MALEADFDVTEAHRYFSADCFNKAWELIEKTDRTPEEDEQMVRLTHASLWHWTQRADRKDSNMSIGFWQVSRVYAILGRFEEARRYARLCLNHSSDDTPLLLAYAHEAMARAENAAGNASSMEQHRTQAMRLADQITDAEDRKLLLADLKTLG